MGLGESSAGWLRGDEAAESRPSLGPAPLAPSPGARCSRKRVESPLVRGRISFDPVSEELVWHKQVFYATPLH